MAEDTSMLDGDELVERDTHTVGDGTPESAPHKPPQVSLLEGQPAAVIGAVVAVAEALLASPALPLPAGVKTGLALLVAAAGAFGVWSRVTPVAAPRLDADTPLSP